MGFTGLYFMTTASIIFRIAAVLYGLNLVAGFVSGRRNGWIRLLLIPALIANAAVVVLRYWPAWPMLPMYLGPMALPLFLGLSAVFEEKRDSDGIFARRMILLFTAIVALSAVCFPKDYYLPFLQSQSLLAHLFFWLGTAGKGCFLVAAAWATAGLRSYRKADRSDGPAPASNRSFRWTVWGFVFWTLSMFAAELWSFLGWGTPVVWDDPAVTTIMATWFFYTCLLHLHLTGSWSVRGRSAYAAAGALVVFGLNCMPDLGPFRWPL